ncbi:M81 family metallopeptidase [Xanthobacter pseudotagetidis]|uniref:M81 family metallopeptidase n=1 Tax=Xanthobacter pseudotagetidis TaxID=3119911 RepID=UPI003726C1E7
MRILIAGFQHETNTFAASKADWHAFTLGENFPPFIRGQALIDRFRGANIAIQGFIECAAANGWTVVPSGWAGATPSGRVTKEAFEHIAGVILEDLNAAIAAGGVDAIYLDLHGAAVAEGEDDPEGELIARLRAVVGAELPIVASLDLHANVSRRMLDLADALTAYRTYPHIDMAETGRRAAALLEKRLALGRRETMAMRRLPFLLSLNVQCTMMEPAASIYALLDALDTAEGTAPSFAMGFASADVPEVGPLLWAYGAGAQKTVDTLYEAAVARRAEWRLDVLDARPAVSEAMALARTADRPIIIADTQDNPGAGGTSKTTGLLHALVDEGAGRAFAGKVALGLICAPEVAAAAHAAGVGAEIDLELGEPVPAFDGTLSEEPLAGRFRVRAVSAGEATIKGPMYTGWKMDLGRCACLEFEGVLIGVCSSNTQPLDRELLRFTGIAPEEMKIVAVKSSVNFRGDFTSCAAAILVAKAPGPMAVDPSDLPWTKLPATMAPLP